MATGANVKAVQRSLGQASASMTLDVYADQFGDDMTRLPPVRTRWWRRETWTGIANTGLIAWEGRSPGG